LISGNPDIDYYQEEKKTIMAKKGSKKGGKKGGKSAGKPEVKKPAGK
jgi:hypothetical protein